MITQEEVWKGLNLKMTRDEIQKIFQSDEYELDNYYSYDLLIEGLHKALNKEVDIELFQNWCILIANVFNYIKDDCGSELINIYNEVGYMFDGASFMDEYNKKDLLEVIASLKYYNHLIENIKNKNNTPFLTDGVERIMVFDHVNRDLDTSVYRVIIKDYNKKIWQIKYVDAGQFDFVEEKNYTFLNENDFENVFNCFFSDDNAEWKEVCNLEF